MDKFNKFTIKKYPFILTFLALIGTILVWVPFFTKGEMAKIFANYDGPNYLIIAKCWYDKACIASQFSPPLSLEYYSAHFPGYPAFIWLANRIVPGWWAMIGITLASTIGMALILYRLIKSLKIKNALWLSSLSLFLPARVVILRSVGAPEPLFIFALLASIYFYRQKKYLFSGLFLLLAQTIKTPAIILFVAYGIDTLIKTAKDKPFIKLKKMVPKVTLLLGPLIILPIFCLFKYKTGDFFAYFHSGDNFHLIFPPFQSFIGSHAWVGGFWLEDIVYIYFIGALAIFSLYKKYRLDIITIFTALFFTATLFISHRDISRYSAPLYPFWIIAFAPFLKKKEFQLAFLIILPAIYLYAINFINYNLSPIANWAPYR